MKPTSMPLDRRSTLWLLAAAALAGCATRDTPPRRLYALTGTPPLPADARPGQDGRAWVLSPQIALPELLDRDEILVAEGQAGLAPWPEARWAEPLRDALPRVLADDLWRLRQPYPVALGTGPQPDSGAESLRLIVQVDEWLARADGAGLQLRLRAALLQAIEHRGRPLRHAWERREPPACCFEPARVVHLVAPVGPCGADAADERRRRVDALAVVEEQQRQRLLDRVDDRATLGCAVETHRREALPAPHVRHREEAAAQAARDLMRVQTHVVDVDVEGEHARFRPDRRPRSGHEGGERRPTGPAAQAHGERDATAVPLQAQHRLARIVGARDHAECKQAAAGVHVDHHVRHDVDGVAEVGDSQIVVGAAEHGEAVLLE